MRFINPKTDFGFKRIFGSEQSHQILISFLNGVLYDGEDKIESLTILNPYQAPKVKGMKDTYLDVKVLLKGGTSVIIEMQVLNVEGFEKRVLYNAAKAELQQAFEIANEVNLTLEELDDLEKREMYIYDERNRMAESERRGEQRGEKRGEKREQVRIAKSLLRMLDNASISQATGLSIEAIQQLRQEVEETEGGGDQS